MVTVRRTAARQGLTAKKGAAGGSRVPRVPQRPTVGDTLAPTRRQKDTRPIARGGRVPAIVRNRMAPQGRSMVPVHEEDDINDDGPGDHRDEGAAS